MDAAGAQGKTSTAEGPLPQLGEVLARTDRFDPPPGLMALSERGPVHRVLNQDGESIWLVCRYAEARAVLEDLRFSSDRFRAVDLDRLTEEQRRIVSDQRLRAGAFINLDPPLHTRYRRLLAGQFTMRRMRRLSGLVEDIVAERLDAMVAAGSPGDLVEGFALPVPSLVTCELLGVPRDDRAVFLEWTQTALRLDKTIDEMHDSRERLREYMGDLVRRKRAEPTDDLLSGLVHNRVADPPLTDDELVNMANQLLIGGHATTANMLGLGVFALLEHPDQLAALRADPGRIPDAVEELLRYLTVIQLGMFRVTTEEVELAGTTIPARGLVIISPLAANRDAGHWPDPATLDLDRRDGPHLAFGHGVHQCIGQQLARTELTIAFTRLLGRLPNLRLAVPAAEVPLRERVAIHGVRSLPVAWDEPPA
ncbi:cytochrome P450 [Saccharothrix syringae]|uniref:Cytochrome P450 n=1 Tax=Saccharothrix syringae TaxID=103733 RepID=A0A5Q0H005_SACSY|nr:cytochrome P450 [Saccharothrix syringae]QFZ19002.1 cytochrome P450 [Saccharothrix syringae]